MDVLKKASCLASTIMLALCLCGLFVSFNNSNPSELVSIKCEKLTPSQQNNRNSSIENSKQLSIEQIRINTDCYDARKNEGKEKFYWRLFLVLISATLGLHIGAIVKGK